MNEARCEPHERHAYVAGLELLALNCGFRWPGCTSALPANRVSGLLKTDAHAGKFGVEAMTESWAVKRKRETTMRGAAMTQGGLFVVRSTADYVAEGRPLRAILEILKMEDGAWAHSAYTQNRDRLIEHDVIKDLCAGVMED